MTPPLFFIPGWCLGRGPLQPLIEALGGTFIDLPGYREQPPAADWPACIDRFAEALPTGCQLGGWSLGAMLALAVAAQVPDKVDRLLLIAGTPSFVQRDDWTAAMPAATLAEFTTAMASDPEAMLPRFVGGFNRGERDARGVTRQLLAAADPRPPVATLIQGLDWLASVDLRPAVDRLTCPTLIVQGELDPLMPAGAGEWLADALPNGQLCRVAGAAHAPFVSAATTVLAASREFLAR